MQDKKKSFLEIGRGAMLERFDYELSRVVDNILDPNTPAKKARKVTVTLTLTPDEDRAVLTHSVVVKPTLQPTNPISGSTAVWKDETGSVQLVEMVPQVPGQTTMDGGEQREPDVIEFRKRA